jgi:hypothetical protein
MSPGAIVEAVESANLNSESFAQHIGCRNRGDPGKSGADPRTLHGKAFHFFGDRNVPSEVFANASVNMVFSFDSRAVDAVTMNFSLARGARVALCAG